MTSHESSSVAVQACSGDVLVASNWFRQKPPTKTVNVSVTCPVTSSINYSMTNPLSGCSPVSLMSGGTFSLFFLTGVPWVTEGQGFEPLHGDSADLPGRMRCRPLHSRYPSLQQLSPMSWSTTSMPVCDSSLTVSLCSNLLMTLWPSEISGRFYLRSPAMATARYCWSVVRCCHGFTLNT